MAKHLLTAFDAPTTAGSCSQPPKATTIAPKVLYRPLVRSTLFQLLAYDFSLYYSIQAPLGPPQSELGRLISMQRRIFVTLGRPLRVLVSENVTQVRLRLEFALLYNFSEHVGVLGILRVVELHCRRPLGLNNILACSVTPSQNTRSWLVTCTMAFRNSSPQMALDRFTHAE